MARVFIASLLLCAAGGLIAEEGSVRSGAELYAAHCIACHQAGGQGAPGIAPPLAGNVGRHAANPEGRAYVVRVPLTGMVGSITVDGVRYSGNMPAVAALGDAEVASVVGHVLRDFNGVADVSWLTAEFVAAVRKAGGTPNETYRLRGRLAAGAGG